MNLWAKLFENTRIFRIKTKMDNNKNINFLS